MSGAAGVRLLLALALLVAAPAGADEQTVDDAVETYARALETAERDPRLAEFAHAERLFARLAEDGAHNPELYTNWGNSALQAEHLGTAVLAYRRALALDPDHPRAVQNLEFARTLLPDWVPMPETASLLDTFFFWHRTVARTDRALAAAAAFAVVGALVAGAIRFGQPALRNAALLPAAVWLALLVSVVFDPADRAADQAVVTADEVIARAADSALAPSVLPAPLPAGVEVRILERRAPWVRVRLANGRDAWLASSAVSLVSPGVD